GTLRAGATLLHTVADAEGRYTLEGLPYGKGNRLRASGPPDEPYFTLTYAVPEVERFKAAELDLPLKRGVWVVGRATDTEGKPVHGRALYFPAPDNPGYPHLRNKARDGSWNNRADDGTYRVVALPGRGLLTFSPASVGYLDGLGRDELPPPLRNAIAEERFSRVVELDVPPDAAEYRRDVQLEAGRPVTVTVLGPDGKPLSGAM